MKAVKNSHNCSKLNIRHFEHLNFRPNKECLLPCCDVFTHRQFLCWWFFVQFVEGDQIFCLKNLYYGCVWAVFVWTYERKFRIRVRVGILKAGDLINENNVFSFFLEYLGSSRTLFPLDKVKIINDVRVPILIIGDAAIHCWIDQSKHILTMLGSQQVNKSLTINSVAQGWLSRMTLNGWKDVGDAHWSA